jgi:hypothetical protein
MWGNFPARTKHLFSEPLTWDFGVVSLQEVSVLAALCTLQHHPTKNVPIDASDYRGSDFDSAKLAAVVPQTERGHFEAIVERPEETEFQQWAGGVPPDHYCSQKL